VPPKPVTGPAWKDSSINTWTPWPLTENGQELKLGDGMWGPTVALGNYKLYFADPQAGQVGFFGTIEEHCHPVILGLRLKVDVNKKISEMEVIALRKTADVFSEPQNFVDKPIFHQAGAF
jgi:hypothetical protein